MVIVYCWVVVEKFFEWRGVVLVICVVGLAVVGVVVSLLLIIYIDFNGW